MWSLQNSIFRELRINAYTEKMILTDEINLDKISGRRLRDALPVNERRNRKIKNLFILKKSKKKENKK